MVDIAALNRTTGLLKDASVRFQVSRWNTPVNRDEEQSKFVRAWNEGREYNPQFEYEQPTNDARAHFESLIDSVEDAGEPWNSMIHGSLTNSLESIGSLIERDPTAITAASINRYGKVSPASLKEAAAILKLEVPEPERSEMGSDEAADELARVLAMSGLDQWTVTTKHPMSADMAVSGGEKQVRVRHGATFSKDAVRRLIIHEIGTHVFRSENGFGQPLKLLGFGLPGYLATEEGLAAYHEEVYGVSSAATLRKYACRVKATEIALSSSFAQTASALDGYLSAEQIFSMLTRVKRGFTDTEAPGAHVKDKVYLEGLMTVRSAVRDDPALLDDLMVGKFAVDQIDVVRDLMQQGLVFPAELSPHRLIEFI